MLWHSALRGLVDTLTTLACALAAVISTTTSPHPIRTLIHPPTRSLPLNLTTSCLKLQCPPVHPAHPIFSRCCCYSSSRTCYGSTASTAGTTCDAIKCRFRRRALLTPSLHPHQSFITHAHLRVPHTRSQPEASAPLALRPALAIAHLLWKHCVNRRYYVRRNQMQIQKASLAYLPRFTHTNPSSRTRTLEYHTHATSPKRLPRYQGE